KGSSSSLKCHHSREYDLKPCCCITCRSKMRFECASLLTFGLFVLASGSRQSYPVPRSIVPSSNRTPFGAVQGSSGIAGSNVGGARTVLGTSPRSTALPRECAECDDR